MFRNKIPNDFAGNILRLALSLSDASADPTLDANSLLRSLSTFTASCIMLDSVRRSIPGSAEDVFKEHYINKCDDALNDFCDQHLPCNFSNHAGRCTNVKSGHEKGKAPDAILDSRGTLIIALKLTSGFKVTRSDWERSTQVILSQPSIRLCLARPGQRGSTAKSSD